MKNMKTNDFYVNGFRVNTERDLIDFNRDEGENSQQYSRYQFGTKYQCVLKCEGNKMYHQAGYCPDCNMKLVSIEESHNRH